jgi:hypothetical protein
MEVIAKLPEDIVNIVLEYQGFHKERNGKFIGQIKQNDSRRELLLKMPKKCISRFGHFVVTINRTIKKRSYIVSIGISLHEGIFTWMYDVAKLKKNEKGGFDIDHYIPKKYIIS